MEGDIWNLHFMVYKFKKKSCVGSLSNKNFQKWYVFYKALSRAAENFRPLSLNLW
jgi:hypothetical protein